MEITGPTDRKMVVNALNSGAKTFMADFEGEFQALSSSVHRTLLAYSNWTDSDPLSFLWPDSTSPTFNNLITGQVNLRDAIRRQVDFEQGGKSYKLVENPATLIVRYVYV